MHASIRIQFEKILSVWLLLVIEVNRANLTKDNSKILIFGLQGVQFNSMKTLTLFGAWTTRRRRNRRIENMMGKMRGYPLQGLPLICF